MRVEIRRMTRHDPVHKWNVVHLDSELQFPCFTAKEARTVARLLRRQRYDDVAALQAPIHTLSRCGCYATDKDYGQDESGFDLEGLEYQGDTASEDAIGAEEWDGDELDDDYVEHRGDEEDAA